MDYPKFFVSNQKEESISMQRFSIDWQLGCYKKDVGNRIESSGSVVNSLYVAPILYGGSVFGLCSAMQYWVSSSPRFFKKAKGILYSPLFVLLSVYTSVCQ